MFLTQSNILRHLTKAEYELISEMCHYSNNLYNSAVYEIRQHYFKTNKYLSYEKNDKICKLNENYKLLQAGVSQQILKVVDRSFKSFFALLNKAKTGNYDKKVRLPYYREKGGMFNLILSTNAINVDEKTNTLRLPMSRTFSKKHDKPVVKIPIPERLKGKEIKEVRIIPVYKGNHFKIQYVYQEEAQPQNLHCDNKLAIDLGVDNLATCVTDKGTSFIMDGRKIKSINQYWNKRKAKLQSVAMKQKLKTTKQLCSLTRKRNSRIDDNLKKTARYIINYCINNDIGMIICGYNKDFKRNVDLGKKNNQHFTQISFTKLKDTIKNLCERYDIKYIEQEESYTSKASFLDNDELPVFKKNTKDEKGKLQCKFSGKRIHRGLYRSKTGRILNADVNGACNILRKSKQNFDFEELCRGLLASPLRIQVS